MNVSSALVADAQPSEALQPTERALDHPAAPAQLVAAFNAPPGNAGLDTLGTQPLPVTSIVVALVGMQFGGALAGPSPQACHGGQTLNQGTQQLGVMDIGRRELGQPFAAFSE